MIKDVVSENQIYLLNPSVLIQGIKKVEQDHPGWWWSLSQRPGQINLSLGPGINGPRDEDRKLASTTEGDNGYHYCLHAFTHAMEEEFLVWLNVVSLSIAPEREKASLLGEADLGVTFPPKGDWYRHQSDQDLHYLETEYQAFLTALSVLEDNDRKLDEVYFGACDTTADCSLRGRQANDKFFVISVDLRDRDQNIGHSLYWSMNELANDILTSQKGNPDDSSSDVRTSNSR